MKFYRTIKEFKGIEPNTIVVDSLYHWYRTVLVATPSKKTKFLYFRLSNIEIKNNEFFEELTMKELDKLRPHLLRTLVADYKISFNENLLSIMPKYCCYPCGANAFRSYPKPKTHNTIGKCNHCNKEKVELHLTEYFKKDIFK